MATKDVLEAADKKLEIKSEEKFDPAKFFKNRKGLYVWGNFTERILSKAEPIKAAKKFTLASFDLTKATTDKTIEANLPKEHLFDESDVCAIIAALIEKQPKGKDGALITTGYANLFYTPAFVVHVYWGAGSAEWRVGAWGRGGSEWSAGSRVFSPAN